MTANEPQLNSNLERAVRLIDAISPESKEDLAQVVLGQVADFLDG